MTELTERQARTIAALAHACKLPWAICPLHCSVHRYRGPDTIPATLEAWREQWAAHADAIGIAPGEGPATSWKSADGRVQWEVRGDVVHIDVGHAWACMGNGAHLEFGEGGCGVTRPADLAMLARLVVAVTEGT